MLIIRNGTLIDPEGQRTFRGDIWIKDGQIARIVEREEKESGLSEGGQEAEAEVPDGTEIIDATGLLAGPGLIDTHVHFRDPGFTYKEDILSGGQAAKKGGYTGIVLMANTKPCVDNEETLSYVLARGKETGIRISSCATVTKGMQGKELVDMEALADAGAAGFTDDGIPMMDEKLLVQAMEQAKALGLPLAFHEEDPALMSEPGVHKGKVAEQIGYGGAARAAEDVMVARDCMLALHTGASVCIQHISSKNSVELVRLAKMLGADVHAEATPHHFTLTEEAVLKYGTLARMNPPLRTEEDRQAIIKGIQDGTIDMIVTDHAPHSEEEKAKPMAQAPSGITGLETSLALGIYSLVEPGYITLMDLMKLMSKNPAEFYRMVPGSVEPEAPADLVIFGEKEQWTVDHFASKATNSPFKGWTLPGKVHYTICAGKIAYKG